MPILETISAIASAVGKIFGFAEKVVPSEKLQEERHEERKPLIEQDNNQKIINDDFNYLKRRVEIDMWDYVRNIHPKMGVEEIARYHKILVARVTEYRKDVVKRKGLRWKKYREWLAGNIL